MSTRAKRIILVVAIVAFLLLLLLFMMGAAIAVGLASLGSQAGFGEKIALIHVEGVMTAGRGSGGVFGDQVAGSERIVLMLEKARKDKSVKAVVIRVNSPGGSPSAAQEIYAQINRLRAHGKRVTVSMGDVAASAAYYISCAGDRIYADPATMTGSIGVIMQTAELHELWKKIGVDMGALTTGKYKDIGSPNRPMRPDEKELLQGMLADIYDQFLTDVAKGRKLDRGYVRDLADGRVFTGRQAQKLKLVDKVGGLQDALRAAANDAGIAGEFQVVQYDTGGLMDLLLGTPSGAAGTGESNSGLESLARKLLLADRVMKLR